MAALRIQLKQLREAQGLTQGELAERANVARATVNRIEAGRQRRVDLDVLEHLATALGVSPGLLITEDGAKRAPRRSK
ncbi:MAG: helix-turn-helix domain-containing protein [Gemmatimonadaceae bacterium]